MAAIPMLAVIEKVELIAEFAHSIKALLELFEKKKEGDAGDDIFVKDCDDAISIVKPIANHGGIQTFNTINGGVTVNIVAMTAPEASRIMDVALQQKALLQNSAAEVRQRVPMVWKRLDRDETRPEAKSTPDRALIEEIDAKSHPVFFTDEMSLPRQRGAGGDARGGVAARPVFLTACDQTHRRVINHQTPTRPAAW